MATRRGPRARAERLRTEALLVRHAPFGEADVMTTLFTEARGVVSAVARSARRSSQRFSALEPMHLLRVGLDERPGQDVLLLAESALAKARLGLVTRLEAMEAAGTALRWVRRAAPPNTPDPRLWAEINGLLDRLDGHGGEPDSLPEGALLAGSGLRILSAVGWGLDLSRCVRCGRQAEPGTSAYVDPGDGGLVCRACGGGRRLLRGEARARLIAASEGDDAQLGPDEARAALELVEEALEAHAK